MRLDRIDGVGAMVWSDPDVVQSTVAGFFEGLAQKPAMPALPDSVDSCFSYYLSVCRREDLFELADAVVNRFHPSASEFSLIKQHLSEHVQTLFRAIREI